MPKNNKKQPGNSTSDKKLKTQVSQLSDDEKCIYQALSDLTGKDMNSLGQTAMATKKIKEVDDEAAAAVLAEALGFTGPQMATGAEFKKKKASANEGKKFFLIVTLDVAVKNWQEFTGRNSQAMKSRLMDPSKNKCVNWHAIGMEVVKQSWLTYDQQNFRQNGPFDNDSVIYWVKG